MPRIPVPFQRSPKPVEPPTQPDQDDAPADGHQLQMTLWDHLNELRVRVFRAVIALVIGTVVGFAFAGPVSDYMRTPYCSVVSEPDQCKLNVLGPTEGVIVYFRVSLMVGAIIAIPMITYQLMMFIVPGLTRKERRFVIMSLPAITLLFIIGVAFAWYILMPPALGFLEGFQPTLFETEWTADLYFSFVTSLLFWMGVAFETPLVFFVMSLLGIVSAGLLVRQWRLAVIVAAIAAALITPTIDPVNMFLVMGPLMALYGLSIVLVFIGSRISGVDRSSEFS